MHPTDFPTCLAKKIPNGGCVTICEKNFHNPGRAVILRDRPMFLLLPMVGTTPAGEAGLETKQIYERGNPASLMPMVGCFLFPQSRSPRGASPTISPLQRRASFSPPLQPGGGGATTSTDTPSQDGHPRPSFQMGPLDSCDTYHSIVCRLEQFQDRPQHLWG